VSVHTSIKGGFICVNVLELYPLDLLRSAMELLADVGYTLDEKGRSGNMVDGICVLLDDEYKGVRNVDSPARMERIAGVLRVNRPNMILTSALQSVREDGGASRTRAVAVADEIAGQAQNLVRGKIRTEHPDYSPTKIGTALRTHAKYIAKPGRDRPAKKQKAA
jgi:hypothetical protein